MRFSDARQFTRLDILVLAAVVCAGLVHLPYPFDGDQAMFANGALKLSRGAILYRDFWDLKQPGIFGFYLLGVGCSASTKWASIYWNCFT